MRQLPLYRCHKVVQAAKIIEAQPDAGQIVIEGNWVLTPDAVWWGRFASGDDNDLGWIVVYADGYQSWSPSKAFVDGYSVVTERRGERRIAEESQ